LIFSYLIFSDNLTNTTIRPLINDGISNNPFPMLRKNEIEYNTLKNNSNLNLGNRWKNYNISQANVFNNNLKDNNKIDLSKDPLILNNRKSAFSVNKMNLKNFQNEKPIIFKPEISVMLETKSTHLNSFSIKKIEKSICLYYRFLI